MNVLYDLHISRMVEECGREYWAEPHVGIFMTKEDAIAVMKRVMSEGGPFSEPDCQARIQEVEVIGDIQNIECVYRFYGMNIDSSLDQDIIESPYYVDKPTAIQEYIKAKKNTPRQKWSLDTYKIGEHR